MALSKTGHSLSGGEGAGVGSYFPSRSGEAKGQPLRIEGRKFALQTKLEPPFETTSSRPSGYESNSVCLTEVLS